MQELIQIKTENQPEAQPLFGEIRNKCFYKTQQGEKDWLNFKPDDLPFQWTAMAYQKPTKPQWHCGKFILLVLFII